MRYRFPTEVRCSYTLTVSPSTPTSATAPFSLSLRQTMSLHAFLCQTEAKKQWLQNAHRTCIISTPFDAARVAKLIYQAIPISRPCHTEDTICFHLGDYIDDVLLEGTQLLYVGSDDTIRRAFSAEPKDNMLFLPGVMSRKKQIIPMLTALWG